MTTLDPCRFPYAATAVAFRNPQARQRFAAKANRVDYIPRQEMWRVIELGGQWN